MSRRRWLIAAAIPAAVLMATPAFAKLSAAGAGGGSARATSITAPGAPTVNGTATSSSVPLQWTAASGPSGTLKYHVERAAFGGSSWTDVCGSTDAAPISGTSCSDGSVSASTDYQYRVTAEIGNWRKTSATSAKISTPAAASMLTITGFTRNGSSRNASFSGSGAAASGVVTVKVCSTNDFPSCTAVASISTDSTPGNPWTTAATGGNPFTVGSQYFARATQGGSTSAVFSFTFS